MKQQTIDHLNYDDSISAYRIALVERVQNDKPVIYARFRIDKPELSKGSPYHWVSMKTDDPEVASHRASEEWGRLLSLQEQNRVFRGVKVSEAIDQFMAEYQERLDYSHTGYSIHMLRGYRKSLVRYWRNYLDDVLLDNISFEHFEGYELWRRRYWRDPRRKRELARKRSIKKTPSPRTISWEIGNFKRLIRWAKDRKLSSSEIPNFKFNEGPKNSRAAFTEDQWKNLVHYSRSNEWLKGGKGLSINGLDKRVSRHRSMLSEWVSLLGHSGLRPGEALKIRWQDVMWTMPSFNQEVAIVSVTATHSKVKKRRQALVNPSGAQALKRLFESREANIFALPKGDFSKQKDFVFCDTDGSAFSDFREGFNKLIYEADVETDNDRNKHVPYTCRHTYITFRLREGTDVYTLAKQCGTSVDMIQKYYDDTMPIDHIDALTKGLSQ
jgi:integrase